MRAFSKRRLCLEFWDAARGLPKHDVVFNMISDADTAGPALQACELLLRLTNAPVFNHPQRIRQTGRCDIGARLDGIDGVRVPRAVSLTKTDLVARGPAALEQHRLIYPLLLRSPGFHNGRYFEFVSEPGELLDRIHRLPGDVILAIEFVDTRNSDDAYWKYRVMMVGGELYPLHLAIANEWNVHYSSANMQDHPHRRETEAAFLRDFRAFLGSTAIRALEGINSTLQLDYGGIDFGLASDGRVVVFEANATMAVIDPPEGDCFEYRKASVERVRTALSNAFLRPEPRVG